MLSVRRLLGAFLVAALLAAQQAVLEHPLWHVAAAGGESKQSDPARAPLCEQHAALGALSGAIDCAATHAAPIALEAAAVAAVPFPARDNTPLSPSSRDPPQLL